MTHLLGLLVLTAPTLTASASCGWFGPTGTRPLADGAWLADASLKVFLTTPEPETNTHPSTAGRPAAAEVCAARNEHQPFQLALRPISAMTGAKLIATPSDPALTVSVSLVTNVHVSVAINAANLTGLFPDALPIVPAAGVALAPDATTAFWITVSSNVSGNYTVSLRLETSTTSASAEAVTALGGKYNELNWPSAMFLRDCSWLQRSPSQ